LKKEIHSKYIINFIIIVEPKRKNFSQVFKISKSLLISPEGERFFVFGKDKDFVYS